jgi:hypothetical protein
MGGDRDLLPDQKTDRQLHFSDDKVCKFYICGLCPHELFTNTRSDLGPCPNLHDDDVKEAYDKCEDKWKYPYEKDFMARMQKMVSDLDRRIDKGHQRLSLQDHENPVTPEKMERIDAISEQVELNLRQMEELGAMGRLQEVQALEIQNQRLMADQEVLKKGSAGASGAMQEKRLKVCEVCGAFLVVGDTEDRIKAHNDGKQHQGYYAIRTILEQKKKLMAEEGRRGLPTAREDRGPRDPVVREGRRSGDRDRPRSDRVDRDRDRDYRSRDHRDHRDRDRDRGRDRDYRRSADGSRRRRERSMDKDDEEYHSSRKRDKDRDSAERGGGSAKRRREEE